LPQNGTIFAGSVFQGLMVTGRGTTAGLRKLCHKFNTYFLAEGDYIGKFNRVNTLSNN